MCFDPVRAFLYRQVNNKSQNGGICVFRFVLSFLGGIFTTLTMSIGMVALTLGAIFWMYGRDLPSHESLAQYTPPRPLMRSAPAAKMCVGPRRSPSR